MSSAAEYYVQNTDHYLWEHMKKYSLETLEDGIRGLKYDPNFINSLLTDSQS